MNMDATSICDRRGDLVGYLYGECEADERRRIEAHLVSCESCAAEVGALRSVRRSLAAWVPPDAELGFRIVSGGTDTHLMLVDVSALGLTGKEAEEALDAVNITANKNAIPNDPRPPRITSGLRVGTPAVTSRGFGPDEMAEIARLMHRMVTNIDDERVKAEVTDAVGELTARFPVPGIDY